MSLENPGNAAFGSGGQNIMNSFGGGGSMWSNPSMWGGIGGIAGGLASFFQQNPADAASKYYNQIPGALGQYLNPYIQNGNDAYGFLKNYMNRGDTAGNLSMGAYSGLVNDPSGFMNKLGSTFQQSPGYNWQTSQALGAANRAAAAGGMAGSPAEQQQIAGVTNQLANQDYYNYLNHVMNTFNTGLNGLNGISDQGYNASQGVYTSGANAANAMAQAMANYYASQGNLAYAGAQNDNNSMLGGIGSLASGIGALAML